MGLLPPFRLMKLKPQTSKAKGKNMECINVIIIQISETGYQCNMALPSLNHGTTIVLFKGKLWWHSRQQKDMLHVTSTASVWKLPEKGRASISYSTWIAPITSMLVCVYRLCLIDDCDCKHGLKITFLNFKMTKSCFNLFAIIFSECLWIYDCPVQLVYFANILVKITFDEDINCF